MTKTQSLHQRTEIGKLQSTTVKKAHALAPTVTPTLDRGEDRYQHRHGLHSYLNQHSKHAGESLDLLGSHLVVDLGPPQTILVIRGAEPSPIMKPRVGVQSPPLLAALIEP